MGGVLAEGGGGVWEPCGTPIYATPSIFDLFSMLLPDSAPKKTRETRLCDLKGSQDDFRPRTIRRQHRRQRLDESHYAAYLHGTGTSIREEEDYSLAYQ